MNALAAPFPYFGGKASAAPLVWNALGDCQSYIEPFAGSAACLLARPGNHAPKRETINDACGFVSNFWRALKSDPAGLAAECDFPVTERDLEARHYWLVTEGAARIAACAGNPDAYELRVAAWWCWGVCAWIGSGWCSGSGPWRWDEDLGWVNREVPRLGDAGQGINRQCPHLGDAGRGINRKVLHLGDARQGVQPSVVAEWFTAIATRLRRVVVCAGDWRRVLASETAMGLNRCSEAGIFLDPPYGADDRTAALYSHDRIGVAADVRAWCLEHGRDIRKRIVLAGYEGEGHEALETVGWRVLSAIPKKRGAGYGNTNGAAAAGGLNRQRERLWLSPACLRAGQGELWHAAAATEAAGA